FFFFQAEDGIRDRNVTGVQTCALPILASITQEPKTLLVLSLKKHLLTLKVAINLLPYQVVWQRYNLSVIYSIQMMKYSLALIYMVAPSVFLNFTRKNTK